MFFNPIRALLTLAIAKGGDEGKPEGANFIDHSSDSEGWR